MKKTREHLKAMGETGAGITCEDQLNMDEENDLVNKWSAYFVLISSTLFLLSF